MGKTKRGEFTIHKPGQLQVRNSQHLLCAQKKNLELQKKEKILARKRYINYEASEGQN